MTNGLQTQVQEAIIQLMGEDKVTPEQAAVLAQEMLERTPLYARAVVRSAEFLRRNGVDGPLDEHVISSPVVALARIMYQGVRRVWVRTPEQLSGQETFSHPDTAPHIARALAACLLLADLVVENGAYVFEDLQPGEFNVLAEIRQMSWPNPPWEPRGARAKRG